MPCRSGLEGLLLGLALQAEQPQLESQRTALLQQEEEQRLQLAALDTQVLQSLATSKASSHTLIDELIFTCASLCSRVSQVGISYASPRFRRPYSRLMPRQKC